jgi:hypothetical protein
VGHECSHRNGGFQMHSSAYCIQIKNLFCAGFFVLLCSKHVSVIFYALDESEKNGQFVL